MQSVEEAFSNGVGSWHGCDWKTSFGPCQTNLEGMCPAETALLAEATQDPERENWLRAGRWLTQVEKDALQAEKLAHQALDAFRVGSLQMALELANRACQIENKYRPHIVWAPFRDALALQLKLSRIKIPFLASSA